MPEPQYADIPHLTDSEAAGRLQRDGYNELPSDRNRNIFAIALEVIKEPMFLLLIACAAVYFFLGDLQEAMLLLGSILIIVGITFFQERKTERALEALKNLSSPRALVIRNGELKRIPGREVVRGDAILVGEGDRVPADGALIRATNVTVDESVLTGESMSVRKTPWDGVLSSARPGGDDLPFVYSGTLVVDGSGILTVTAAGISTEMGKIGRSLQMLVPEETLLRKQIKKMVAWFGLWALFLCLFVIFAYGIIEHQWVQGLLSGLALAMSLIPEEFPVILTVFLALGAWRLSKRNVLTRRVPVIETLGAATTLCVDKTGTLTMNRMSITTLWRDGTVWEEQEEHRELSPDFGTLVHTMAFAHQNRPFDPMDRAMREFAERTKHLAPPAETNLIKQYPLTSKFPASVRIWKEGGAFTAAVIGAPETVLALAKMHADKTTRVREAIEDLAKSGLRILGVARSAEPFTDAPADPHEIPFVFEGLVGFIDPVRPGVAEAINECYAAGIRPIMITGDYPGTAKHVAERIGLPAEHVITGEELDRMNDAELAERIGNTSVFARVVPEQKLRIVSALKTNGEIVAMTGDGVNDAPALKAAHIGIAMGERGTDVAREAAALVLLDDSFNSIVEGIRHGRAIYENIRKAIAYIFAIHFPIAGLALLPVLFGWPAILFPVHIVFLELIIDPACSIIFESERPEKDIMKRKPRKLDEPLLKRHRIIMVVLQGVVMLACAVAMYLVFLSMAGEAIARTMTFVLLVGGNLGFIFVNRSWARSLGALIKEPNPALGYITITVSALLIAAVYSPAREVFHFAPLSRNAFFIVLVAIAALTIILELIKEFTRRLRYLM